MIKNFKSLLYLSKINKFLNSLSMFQKVQKQQLWSSSLINYLMPPTLFHMSNKFEKNYQLITNNGFQGQYIYIFISSYLNPFFKDEMKENTVQYFRMVELFYKCLEDPIIEEYLSLRTTLMKKPKRVSNAFHDNEETEEGVKVDLKQTVQAEIENKNQISYDEKDYANDQIHSTLNFWKIHQQKLPFLNILAKKYLALPASSAESQRVFSAIGNLITKLRNKLNSETASEIIYIHFNLKHEFISIEELQNTFIQQV